MEIWDAYHRDGTPAGCDLIRGEGIPEGLYHLVSEILVRHTDGDYLLMQRDSRKPNYGGWYEATAGGSALKGENAGDCARRELREETGISRGEWSLIGGHASRDTIYRQFLCVTDWAKDTVICQEGETTGYRWVSREEFLAFMASERAIPVQRERLRHYWRQLGCNQCKTPPFSE